jgi:hypothetical protein
LVGAMKLRQPIFWLNELHSNPILLIPNNLHETQQMDVEKKRKLEQQMDNGGIIDEKVSKMMKKMGFEDGKGLGKYLQGNVSPPKLKMQRGRAGLDFHKPLKVGRFKCVLCCRVFDEYELIEAHFSSKTHTKSLNRKAALGPSTSPQVRAVVLQMNS